MAAREPVFRVAVVGFLVALWLAVFLLAQDRGVFDGLPWSSAGAEVPAESEVGCPPESEWPSGMVCVEGGSFKRSALETSCEHPESKDSIYGQQAEVSVAPFFVDRTEVTVAAWARCRQACACDEIEGSLPEPGHPQTGVTWQQATDYCSAFGKRLLTEAEWDRALRGGDGSAVVLGPGEPTCETAVLETEAGKACGRGDAWPVDELPEQGGVRGMVGNAPEWVSDWYSPNLDACGPACGGEDPQGLCGGAAACESSTHRTLKGGSWADDASCVFGQHRRAGDPEDTERKGFAFRCAVAVEDLAGVRAEPSLAASLIQGSSQSNSWYSEDPVYRSWRRRWGTGEGKRTLTIDEAGQTYKDPEMVAHLLQTYHAAFPAVTTVEELGKTHHGRSIWALRITDPNVPRRDKPAVFLNGAHHGHELLSIEYAMDAVHEILTGWQRQDARISRWVQGLDIWVVPVVNPDGLWLTMNLHHGDGGESLGGRKNGRDIPRTVCDDLTLRNGVDLNRNYPYAFDSKGHSTRKGRWNYRGPSGGSEPETQAIMALAERQRFVAAITFHTKGSMIITPYTVGEHTNPSPDVAWHIAEKIVPHRFEVKQSMYPVSGTDQDWLYYTFGTLSYILEGDLHNPPDFSSRLASVRKVRPSFGRLFDAVLGDGAVRVSGHVVDGAGKPVEAEIRIAGHEVHHGERWTSRPADGRFDRLLLDGTTRVTLTAEGPGGKTATAEVDLSAESAPVVLTLQ